MESGTAAQCLVLLKVKEIYMLADFWHVSEFQSNAIFFNRQPQLTSLFEE